ncbi:hypothetical protein AA313_de0203677 [Arthrobotrys entomopaga]|nr:hypothetical protein AA313_de0203677 [Arthrobotrys entomopaga]
MEGNPMEEITDEMVEEDGVKLAEDEMVEGSEQFEDEVGEDVGEEDLEEGGDDADKKEAGTRTSARRSTTAGLDKSNSIRSSTRTAAKATPTKSTSRPSRGRSTAEPEKVVQEVTTTRSGRTTRSALSTPKNVEKKESPAPSVQASATAAPAPLKITTRKQTVTTPASPSSPAVSKTRVSLKSLSTGTPSTPAPSSSAADAKSPSSIRSNEPKSSTSGAAMAPVVMLFGYPAGANPPCEVSSVSVTVESTKTNRICMMTAEDMRRPATPIADGDGESADKMDVDESKEGEKKEEEKKTEEKTEGKEETTTTVLDTDTPLVPAEKVAVGGGESVPRNSSTPDSNANGRFSWDLVVQMLKADIGFDPAKDELVGFHHKDPLPLSCDRHLNTAMVMAAKEGVRMPKWYVYPKQTQPQQPVVQ